MIMHKIDAAISKMTIPKAFSKERIQDVLVISVRLVATWLVVAGSLFNSDWEQGRSEPNIELIKKLCDVLNVSADELLEIK